MNPSGQAVSPFGPIAGGERISCVDAVRGFALLGILLMNIVGWGFPSATYSNPLVAGGTTGWNLAAWVVQMTAFDGKMRALFSMLFGAGAVIFTSRGESRGAGVRTADLYYRRMYWLMLFGVAHAFLLWWGDILYPYGLYGLLLFPMRNVRPRNLLIAAGVMFAVLTGMSLRMGFELRESRAKAEAAVAAEKAGKTLTAEQKKAKDEWEKSRKQMQPPPEDLKKETDAFRGGFIANTKQRVALVMPWHSLPYYSPLSLDMLAMMLVGMAFVKLGILTGARPRAYYGKMAVAGLLIGLPLNGVSAWQGVVNHFDIATMPIILCTYHAGRLAVALGYMSLLIVLVQVGVLRWLTSALAAVGQMALSNYIAQSVLCNLMFYGVGLGLFGKLERYQLYGVVLVVWIFHLVWSPLWLRAFRFGPLEWCWRSLTYWKRQPFRQGIRGGGHAYGLAIGNGA